MFQNPIFLIVSVIFNEQFKQKITYKNIYRITKITDRLIAQRAQILKK